MMGLEFMGEIPFSDVDHQRHHPGRRRPAHVEVARHRRRPARARRVLRRRRHPLRPPEDELDPGRALRARARSPRGRSSRTSSGTRPGSWSRRPTRRSRPAPAGDEPADRWVRSRLAATLDEVLRPARRLRVRGRGEGPLRVRRSTSATGTSRRPSRACRAPTPTARRDVSANLLWTLERILALTHPVCPFVTEAVWSHLPGERGLLMLEPFPAAVAEHRDPRRRGRRAGRHRRCLRGPLDARRAAGAAARVPGGGARARAGAAGDARWWRTR